MVPRILTKLKKFYLKGLAQERRRDRSIANTPFAVKDEKSMKKYFDAQKRIRKANNARQKRRERNKKTE